MKNVIIFDFDGTIANTLPTVIKILKTVMKDFGYESITTGEIEKLRGMSPLDIVVHLKVPIWKIPKLISAIRNKLHDQIENVELFPGIEKVLLEIKFRGYKLAILSSNKKETLDKFLEKKQLMFFDFVQSEPNVFEKSKLIKKFLRQNKIKAEDVIYIGDEVRDIEACKKSGVLIIAVSWGFNKSTILKKFKPDYLVNKPREILDILRK